MDTASLQSLVHELTSLPSETEWVEFKHNAADPKDIGEYLSALSNSAALHGEQTGYIIWGIESQTHNVICTTFKPRQRKVGNEELENWLATQLMPQTDFRIHEFQLAGREIVLFDVPRATHMPVRFRGMEFHG